MKNIFLDDIGRTLYNEYVFVANVPYRSMLKLLKENNSVLFDNVKTKDVESRDDILRASLSDALSYLEEKLGKDPTQWQWGKLHTVTFKHMFHGQIKPMDELIDIGPYEIGGSGTTVFNTEYSFNDPYDNYLGPSMRYIYDFARPDEFYMILTTGESGNVMSKHYRDMTEMWLTGKYIKVNINDDYIQKAGYKRFILK
jgi:penicillin amidase